MGAGFDEGCIFCRIVRGDFGTEFVAETSEAAAFHDIEPKAPVHILIVPKRHLRSLSDLVEGDERLAGEMVLLTARIAREVGIADSGYRVVSNNGPDGGQTVGHLHFHLMGGHHLTAGLG